MCPFCPLGCSVVARAHGPSNPGLVKNGLPRADAGVRSGTAPSHAVGADPAFLIPGFPVNCVRRGVLRFDEPYQLRQSIEENLATLGVSRLAAVNLRVMAPAESPGTRFDAQLATLVKAREEGLIGASDSATSPGSTCCAPSARPRSPACRTCST